MQSVHCTKCGSNDVQPIENSRLSAHVGLVNLETGPQRYRCQYCQTVFLADEAALLLGGDLVGGDKVTNNYGVSQTEVSLTEQIKTCQAWVARAVANEVLPADASQQLDAAILRGADAVDDLRKAWRAAYRGKLDVILRLLDDLVTRLT